MSDSRQNVQDLENKLDRSWWSSASPCSRSLDGMLPGILIGEKVRLCHGSETGTIIATGHQYGPGSGHDQAQVHFRTWHAGDPEASHPIKRRGCWTESECWYYLTSLELSSENDTMEARDNQSSESTEEPDVECWCGAKGAYEELFLDEHLDDGCGGTGVLNCRCGGDLCVCHNHGEVECSGCDDCDEFDDSDLGDDDFFDPQNR